MEYGYKTLILVDNSASVTSGNQQIVKETLKYLIKNADEKDEFALATYSSQTELLVDYGAPKEEYMQAIDKLAYTEKTTCLSDVLMGTVNSWREADFALRNIILFTDGQLNESDTYPIEEVYFRLNESSYPIYAVGLNQQTNEPMLKRIAALARISHGEMFYSEFEDSESGVEIKLTEKLLKAMNDRRTAMEEINNEKEENASTGDETGVVPGEYADVCTEDYESDSYAAPYTGDVSTESIVKSESGYGDYVPLVVIGAVISIVFVLIILMGIGRRRVRPDNEKAVQFTAPEIVLEDMNNPMMYFRLPKGESVTLGADKTKTDITIGNDEGIEGRHCSINYHFGKYYVRDLGTETGTYLNGERIGNETMLKSADVISIGRARLMVKIS